MSSQTLDNQSVWPFRIGMAGSLLLLATLLCIFLPPIPVLALSIVAVLIWAAFYHPNSILGVVLAIMPLHFLGIILGQFYGLPHMTAISFATKELPLLLLMFTLWSKNGIKLATPDWFLLACFMLAAARTVFGGKVAGLRDDFEFLIPYILGRVTILTVNQEDLWAKCAVWIAAVVSLCGMVEVLFLGPLPRTVLYDVVSTDLVSTAPGRLPNSFYATGFDGIRAASTMIGPPTLAALCMVALIVWWVYLRNPLPAMIIGAGLLLALTRSAWIGLGLAISILAFRLDQKRRLIPYLLLSVIAFLALIPILGIRDYLSLARGGLDESSINHQESIAAGLDYVFTHPLGSGAANVGPIAAQRDASALITENTYLALAAEYGVVAALCFICYWLSALYLAWRQRSRIAYVTTGILVGFGLMMLVLLVHEDFRLACWVWFPIGLMVRSSVNRAGSRGSVLERAVEIAGA